MSKDLLAPSIFGLLQKVPATPLYEGVLGLRGVSMQGGTPQGPPRKQPPCKVKGYLGGFMGDTPGRGSEEFPTGGPSYHVNTW